MSKKTDMKRPYKGHDVNYYPDRFTVLDIETTGRSPARDFISEISMVRYINGTEDAHFTSLLKPPRAAYNGYLISAYAAELTGITHNMLLCAPDYEEVLSEFRAFAGDDVLVGHNIGFDVSFLYDNCERYGFGYVGNDYIDTLKLSRNMFPDIPGHRLVDLADMFHIDREGTHRALTDCYITKQVFDCLMEHQGIGVGEKQMSFLE